MTLILSLLCLMSYGMSGGYEGLAFIIFFIFDEKKTEIIVFFVRLIF